MKEYAVIVRTNAYAGNFERELCAHLTGMVGECEVGEEYVDNEVKEIFEESVTEKSDDHGCYRPVSLGGDLVTSKYNANDVVIWFSEEPTPEQMETIRERAKTFVAEYTSKREWNKPFEIGEIEAIKYWHSVTVKNLEI